jgi:thiopurine S-methyltransferase
MQAEFWYKRWEANEIGFHQSQINAHLQQFWHCLGLQAGARVFVPLCGKSRDMLWLAGQGHVLVGVELSPLAVAEFFRENNLIPRCTQAGAFERWEADGVRLLCGDFFALRGSELANVAGVYDRASLIALPPVMRGAYARHLTAILPPSAAMLLVTLEYPPTEMQGPPFSVTEAEIYDLYEKHYQVELIFVHDALAEHPRFQNRGLTRLTEKVYRLVAKAMASPDAPS